jgi:hypothetical protein
MLCNLSRAAILPQTSTFKPNQTARLARISVIPFWVEFIGLIFTFVAVMLQPLEPAAPFDAFRKIVLADPLLLEQLRATPDVPSFIALVREMAGQHGFQFAVEDVQAALRGSQQAWIERWL